MAGMKSAFIETVFQLVQKGVTDRKEILAEVKDGNYPDVYMFNVDNALRQINSGVYKGIQKEEVASDVDSPNNPD